MTLPVCATAVNALQGLWPAIPFIAVAPETQIILQLGTTFAASPPAPASSTPSKASKRKKAAQEKAVPPVPPTSPSPPKATKPESSGSKLRIAVLPLLPFLTSTILRGPTLPKPLLEPYRHPQYPLQILSAVQSSYSGVVVVGETLSSTTGELEVAEHMRYLRAGHSLLGGVWIGPKAVATEPGFVLKDEAGEELGDSIYSAFVLQEAARLVVKKPGHGTPKNALMIGLGAGISATSFVRHGLDTTIVEIDGAVYDAAHRFFGLPTPAPDRLFIQDARSWVHNRSVTLTGSSTSTPGNEDVTSPELFDIVIHDCFSGGGVPSHLYTQEFWRELKSIVRPDGVVAVNFAGILESSSGKAIVHTLQSSFPQCRTFYDSLEPSTRNITSEFLNWVFFCTLSPERVEFRRPVDADYLGSYLRRHVFNNIPEREADVSVVVDAIPEDDRERYLLKDSANPLGEWQQKEAIAHWKIMRAVLPDVYWETY
ncbi:S-adenosyl-L-methionine-dependent methyltransferase [Trametes elegans]|nr:S-adenosyl-L-methionine-dependent methyltransferase [Trametes elegans]